MKKMEKRKKTKTKDKNLKLTEWMCVIDWWMRSLIVYEININEIIVIDTN